MRWVRVASASPSDSSALYAVSASSAGQAWAVGLDLSAPNTKLILHWEGDSWTQVPTPSEPGSQASFLSGIWTRTSKDATAVGSSVSQSHATSAVILHWNGVRWLHS